MKDHRPEAEDSKGRGPLLVLVAVAAVKLALAGSWGLLADEAYHWTWSLAPALGYYDQPPLVAWVLAAERMVFGDRALALRLVPIALWCAAVAAALPLVRDRGLWLGWALGLPPLAFMTNLAVPDALLLGTWLLAVRAAAVGGRGWWAAGVLAGLAGSSKYTGFVLLPLLIAGAPPGERRTTDPWVGLGLALAVVAPNLGWNAVHDGASLRFALGRGLFDPDPPGLWGPLIAVVEQGLVAGPLALVAAVVVLGERIRRWSALDRVDRLCVAASGPVLAGFALAAVFGSPEAHWPAPAWIGIGLLLARSAGRVARLGRVAMAMGVLVTGLLAVHSVHPLVALEDDPGSRFTEGAMLGAEVERFASPAAGEPDGHAVLTERYQEAALIRWNTGVEARVMPGCGRESQDDLEPFEIPEDAVFVRPTTGGPPRCALDRCASAGRPTIIRTIDRFDRRVGPWDVFELRGCR